MVGLQEVFFYCSVSTQCKLREDRDFTFPAESRRAWNSAGAHHTFAE